MTHCRITFYSITFLIMTLPNVTLKNDIPNKVTQQNDITNNDSLQNDTVKWHS